MLLQPWLGYWHHRRYRVLRRKTAWTHTHVWLGRILVVLGITNGGIGFSLASGGVAYSHVGMIIYATFASVAGLVMISLVLYTTLSSKGKKEQEDFDLTSGHR